MQEAAYKVRQFYEDGKAYFTKETPFKDRHAFHKRQEEAHRIMKKYPNRIPEFLYVIRKRIKIRPEQSIYLFVGDSVMVAGAQQMGSVYEEHKDLDGFLYTCYSGENTFG